MSTVLKEVSSGLIFAKIQENDKISNIDENNVLKLYCTVPVNNISDYSSYENNTFDHKRFQDSGKVPRHPKVGV